MPLTTPYSIPCARSVATPPLETTLVSSAARPARASSDEASVPTHAMPAGATGRAPLRNTPGTVANTADFRSV